MELRGGSRLKSSVCSTETIVVKAPDGDVDVCCGGVAMVDAAAEPAAGEASADHMGGTALGKRYVNEDESLEILCTKPGDGSLSIGDTPMTLKENKPLPASD